MYENLFGPTQDTSGRAVVLVSWLLGILFILISLDFFFSINWDYEASFYPVLLDAAFFILLGLTMVFLAIGTVMRKRWIKGPLILVFMSNLMLLIYSTFLTQDWVTAAASLVGVFLLGHFLLKTRTHLTGKKLWFLQGIFILALLPGTLFLLLSLTFQDEQLLDDATLRLEQVDLVTDSRNVYATLMTMPDEIPLENERNQLLESYPESWDQATANNILNDLNVYKTTYEAAARQTHYQCPISINNFSMQAELCELNLLRDYAELMKFAALTEAWNGNNTLALEYAMAPIKVGSVMVQSDNVTIIEYLVGLASMNIGLDTLNILADQQNTTLNERDSQTLKGLMIPDDALSTPLKREYLGFRTAVDETLVLNQNYFYHPNRTRNELFEFMSKVISNSSGACSNKPESGRTEADIEMDNYIINVRSEAFNPTKPNMIGKMYVSVVLASLSGVKDKQCGVNNEITEYIDQM